MAFYKPSRSLRLGRHFAKRHRSEYEWIAKQTQHQDSFNGVCAIDVLLLMPRFDLRIAPKLNALTLPMPNALLEILRIDFEMNLRVLGEPFPDIDTLGSYFHWAFNEPEFSSGS